jgi:multicomponent Na+:H+ antiporter subunit E
VTRYLWLGSALMAIWILLWGELSVGNLATGLVLIPLLLVITRTRRMAPEHRVRPAQLIALGGYFIWALVRSTMQVVMAVLVPNERRLRSGIVAAPITTRSRLVATVVSDLITLTPGTLVVEMDEDPFVLYVHVLGLGDVATVRADVLALEQRVLGAIAPVGVSA